MRFLSTLVASALGTLLALGLIVFFCFLLIFAIALSGDETPRVRDASVLVVNFDGAIPETVADDPFARAFGEGPSYDLRGLTRALRMAAADERIEGVWLQFRYPQASWATLEEVRTALLAYKESDKPLYASADDYAFSEDAYFLAAVADSVFAAPQAFFEFNGFYIAAEFYQNTLEKLDIEPQVVRAGKYKSAVEQFTRENLSPESREQLDALLQTQNQRFMEAVAESRGLSADSLRRLASEAALITADDAARVGLLDGLRFRDEVTALWKDRLNLDADDDLNTIEISRYARVPASEAGLETGDEGDVAVVYAEGQIVSGEGEDLVFGGPELLGAETFNRAMRRARESDAVKAVVVRINSPGGSAAAANAMWRAVELTEQEKPVIVSMGGVAASGGYWIATAADTIVADPLSITGSIGVFSVLFDASGFFNEKLGVTFDLLQTSPYADLFSGLNPLSPQERRLLENSTDDTYRAFLEKVAASSGLSVEKVDAIAQGRVWSGEDALRVGLVDTLGTLEDAIALAARKAGLEDGTYRTRTLPRPKTFFERFGDAFSTQAAQTWTRLTTSPAERALLAQRLLLQRLADEHGTVQARLPFDIRIE